MTKNHGAPNPAPRELLKRIGIHTKACYRVHTKSRYSLATGSPGKTAQDHGSERAPMLDKWSIPSQLTETLAHNVPALGLEALFPS